MRRGNRGQVTVEVAVLFSAVVAALVFMAVYIQRGAQGGLKGSADSFGAQFSTLSGWASHSESKSRDTGAATSSASCTEYQHTLVTTGGAAAPVAPDCTPPALPTAP